ncbi:AAA family ATPase [Erwinia sp. Eh17-17]|jgi:glucokinase|uniref:AAA family ATPase n=1 Tax=Erwinia sp. Eh17-17 TaxID=3080330 RepID=UPI003208973D
MPEQPVLQHSAQQPGAKRLVMVNGVPASGKSHIATRLATETGWPLLTLDQIKEPFMRQIDGIDRPMNRRLGIAAYQVIWSIIAAAPAGNTFIVDAWFGFQPKADLAAFIHTAGIECVAEVWCQIPGVLAAKRYSDRLGVRLPGHPGAEYVAELQQLADRAEPMQLGPVWVADQRSEIDFTRLIHWLQENLNQV